jgi:hypothetical protein
MSQGFGRIEKRRQRLEERQDKLRDSNEMVLWEVVLRVLEQLPRKERKSNAGRKGIAPLVLLNHFTLLLTYLQRKTIFLKHHPGIQNPKSRMELTSLKNHFPNVTAAEQASG